MYVLKYFTTFNVQLKMAVVFKIVVLDENFDPACFDPNLAKRYSDL